MKQLLELSKLSSSLKKERGIEHIIPEILQQPQVWKETVAVVRKYSKLIRDIISSWESPDGELSIVMTGAGSSEFIGTAISSIVRKGFHIDVHSYPTTHFVTHPDVLLLPDKKYLVISFARSGNSPESLFTYNYLSHCSVPVKQIIITCNKDGELAKLAAGDPNSLCIVLPEATNDTALAMTSSFSSMALMGIGLSFPPENSEFEELIGKVRSCAQRILSAESGKILHLAELHFQRACYLGSNTLYGTMQECSLKMQEMTAGNVVSLFNSFLGIRHGPMVFIDGECLVVAALSSQPRIRTYELDLLRQLKSNKQGCAVLSICDRVNDEISDLSTHVVELMPNGSGLDDEFRVLTDVVVGQILAVGKSMALGLKPDDPSPEGIISRVVQGVKIYE